MLKTVRHGVGDAVAELEYTILPQSDDRWPQSDDRSASSGEDEPTRAGHPHRRHTCGYHQHRGDATATTTRRTVIVIVAMLVLGCGVVAAAVLVPILLAARLVSVPASARLQTFAVAASGVIHSARGDYVQLLPVKHAPPGTVIEFGPLQQPPPPPPATDSRRRRRRSAAVRSRAVGRPRRRLRSWRAVSGGGGHGFRAGSSAGFRSLDFRIRR